jgi:hypothetical protein
MTSGSYLSILIEQSTYVMIIYEFDRMKVMDLQSLFNEPIIEQTYLDPGLW